MSAHGAWKYLVYIYILGDTRVLLHIYTYLQSKNYDNWLILYFHLFLSFKSIYYLYVWKLKIVLTIIMFLKYLSILNHNWIASIVDLYIFSSNLVEILFKFVVA